MYSNAPYDHDVIVEEEVEFYDAESDITEDSFYVRDAYDGTPTRVSPRERARYDPWSYVKRYSPYSSFDDYFGPAKSRPHQYKGQQITGKRI